jgi:hypothetical protein
MYKTVKTGEQIAPLDLANAYGEHFFEEAQLMYQLYSSSLHLRLLDNALCTGKACADFSLYNRDHAETRSALFNFVTAQAGEVEPQKIRQWLLGLVERANGKETTFEFPFSNDEGVCIISYSELPGMRVFSPFAKSRLKPLKSHPPGWNLTHVRRALANGQFANFRCNGVYTDDYAFDSAVNFQKGEIVGVDEFLKKLVESPSGWRTSLDKTTKQVSICCHHFDNNSFLLSL